MINTAWRDNSSKDNPSNAASADCNEIFDMPRTTRVADIINKTPIPALSF